MTLADEEKSTDGKKWMMNELMASGFVGEDIFIEFRLELDEMSPHHDHHRFILYRENQPIPSHRYHVQTRGKIVQLTLKQSQKDDTGHYALVAKKLSANDYSLNENDHKEIIRQKIRMNVRESSDNPDEDEPPVFVRRLTDLSVKVGTRTRFLVEIRSSSSPKVTWHRNDLPVQTGSRFSFVHEGNFYCVDVAPVMVEDQGHWTCMAENINGRSSCTSCLSVIVPKAYKPPEFVEKLRALLTETGTVSLECKVVGVPTPVLRWFKDEKEIKAGDVFALTANVDDPTSLGTYACQALNCMGTACSSSRVHVMGRGSREGSLKPADTLLPAGPLPVFKKILKDESCRIGESITLSCQVQVPPWPKAITWYNKEGRVEPDEKYHVIEDGLGIYSIKVNGVEAMDEGEWKCVATSAENVMQFTTCFVAMSIPKNYRMPRFMESLKAVLTDEGLVSFECKVVGFPTPLLRWFKDGQELKPGDVYQLTGTNSLGSYCCIAKNCMGEARSTAELTVEDIQNQLNEEERLQLMSTNDVPKFIKGLRSCEARIHEDFKFTIQVSISPAPTLSWYRDDEPIIEGDKYKMIREVLGTCHLEVHKLEFIDQAEWKCVAANDFGHSITSCFLKLIIPKHFKKPKFLESLRAILSEEGAVNLECKVIGVPQPILKWYKDGVELKPGDIHRIISGQDGTCSLGVYTCEAINCMGSVSSSASLLGFDDRVGARNEESKEPNSPLPHELARNLSLSTIHEERTSQLYDTPQTDHSITIDDRGEVSFSFDGKEVSVSLYETPDLTEEEAIQIVEMYADQLSEHITEGNVIELPPMRFMKETSTTGNLLMEAVVIDVSPDYFAGEDEVDDLRTEADFEDVSIMDDQMQSILSSYSAPPDEQSGERTPMGSPPPRPPRRKERSGSASSKSEKSDKSQPKMFDWSESYHSAKEPSMHAQLSLQSQDSVDAFADALSSEGLVKLLPKETTVKTVSDVEEHMYTYETIQDELENVPAALRQSPEFTEEVFAAALNAESSGKRKRKKKQSVGGTPMLASKTSSEESYTMGVDGCEPEETVQKRGSSAGKEKRERRDSSSSNKSNRSAKSGKEKKKRKSRESEQSLKIEEMKLEKMETMLAPQIPDKSGEYYTEKGDGLLEVRPASTAGEISDKSISKSQKERLLENLNSLSNPVLVLRNTLVDLDNILMTYSENKKNDETIRALILERIVQPVENLCEQMSVIEIKAVKSAGDRSLMQNIRISLLDSIGGPTEELLRGIELIRSHEYKSLEDFKSDLIVLESLTDPVDEIIAGLAKMHHDLKCEEGIAVPFECQEHPIILERMTRAISRLGINVSEIVRQNQTSSVDLRTTIIGERLECIYQNLDSFVIALPLDKITGALESNVDTLVIETLVKPLEGLIRVLSKVSSHGIVHCDEQTIDSLQKAIFEVKTKLETLTIALETYEMESGELGVTEKNLELVNYLKWTMDDVSEKLIKLKTPKTINVSKVDDVDDVPGCIPVSSDEEWELDSVRIGEKSPQSSKVIGDVRIIEDEVETLPKVNESGELTKPHTAIGEKEMEATIAEELTPKVQIKSQPADASSKRMEYKKRLTSLDSATVEFDETLSLPEMLLDPLIDVQAKLNRALRHYEDQNPTDASSSPITEISNCLTQLRESVASAAHIATTLNISNTLNSMIDLREPLLDFQLALSSDPSSQEIILLEEVIRPVNELKELVSATIRSSSVSESSRVILKQVVRMIDDIQESLPSMSAQEISSETPSSPVLKMVAIQPPKEIEHASLSLSGVHFALSSVLAMANDHPISESSNGKSVIDGKNATSAYKLISSIETLRQSVGDVAVSIASPVVPEGSSSEYNYEVVSDELTKLKEPLLDLQKVLLTEKHQPEERHVLNGIATPLRALREAILEVSKGRSYPVLELLEDVEKDVSLIAMEALKKSLEGKIVKEESSISDLTPGEVPRIVSRWLDPIENWLTSASTEIDEKGQTKSIVAPLVDNLKRQLLKIAIQSSYSEPPSDIALIEELAELREPLSKVCEVIASQHNSGDLEVMESLIQPTKHLLGTLLDTSLIHRASSVLRPVIEALEELENQIPLSIKTATYERTLQDVVRSMTPENFEGDENIKCLEQLENVEVSEESGIAGEAIEKTNVNSDAATSFQIKVDVHDAPIMVLSDIVEHEESIPVGEEKICIRELPQVKHDNATSKATTENMELVEDINFNEQLNEVPINVDFAAEEEVMKRRQSQISSATARAEELDLWTLTLLGPLERLANTTLSLDRSIDKDIHAHLCRPLDSLYKQIELVESQINRPAGQTLENDVETIIEGFLSPVNQVATALKVAMDVWHETPAKDVVRQHLHDLSESCSDLCEQLESLRQKLITEAPVQTLQVQKAEASVVETIMAVLGPLEGIRKVILKILEENQVESERETDNLTILRHTDEEIEFRDGICDVDKDYTSGEVTENLISVEAHDSEPHEEIKHIEVATARPLQELIEAIVDPDSVRHTSTTPEEMEKVENTQDKNGIREKNLHEICKAAEDNAKVDAALDNNKIRDETTLTTAQKVIVDQLNLVKEEITRDIIANVDQEQIELIAAQQTQDEFIKSDETESIQGMSMQYLQDSQQFEETVSEDIIPNIAGGELQEYESQCIETKDIGKAILVQMEQTFTKPSTTSELQIVKIAIHDLILEELEKQKIEPSKNEDLITIIEEKLHRVVLQHPTTSQKHILKATIHDTILDMHELCEKVIDDGKSIVPEEVATTVSLSEAGETPSPIDGEAETSLSLSKVEGIKTEIVQEEAITDDTTIYVNRIRDIALSELDRQNALSFDNVGLMKNIERSVKEMMEKCPQICQENVFVESVRDIVDEELRKIKNHHVEDITMTTGEITEKQNDVQERSAVAIKIAQERIHELVQDELCKQNIQPEDVNDLVQVVETKIQDTIFSCPQIIQENSLEESIHEIIVEEISKREAGTNLTESLPNVENLFLDVKTEPLISKITDLPVIEEIIQNIVLNELQQQRVLTSISDKFTKMVVAKIQETMVAYPEKLQENVEEIVRNTVLEELEKSKEIHDVEDLGYAQECNSNIEVKTKEPMATSAAAEVIKEKIQYIVEDEIQKQNIQLVNQHAIVESVQAKIQEITVLSLQISEQNTSENLIRKMIVDQIQKRISELEHCEGSSSDINIVTSSVSTILDEQTALVFNEIVPEGHIHNLNNPILETQTGSVHQENNNLSTILSPRHETISQSPEISQEQILEENTDKHRVKYSEDQNMESTTAGEMVKHVETSVDDTGVHSEKITEIQSSDTANMSEEEIFEKHIQDLLTEEIIEQNAESYLNDEFLNTTTANIQQIVINNPKVDIDDLLKVTVRKIIVEKLEDDKAIIIQAENLNETTKLKVECPTTTTETPGSIPQGNIHKMIIEELHKQNIEPTGNENLTSFIESNVQDLIAKLPEGPTAHTIEESIQDIIVETLEKRKADIIETEASARADEQKVKIKINAFSLPDETKIPEEIVHELIIEELHKYRVHPSSEASVIKTVKTKVHELMVQQSNISDFDTLEKSVHDMVVEVIKEEKAQMIEIGELSEADELEIKVENIAKPSTIQGQASPVPEEMFHELVVDELHKQNIQVAEEGNIMQAIQADIQMLIIQNPDITELDALEESIQSIVTRALVAEKAKLSRNETLVTAEIKEVIVQDIKLSPPVQIEPLPATVVHSLIIEELHRQNIEPLQENNLIKSVEEKIHELTLQHPEISELNTLQENIKVAVVDILKEQKADVVKMDEHTTSKENKVKLTDMEIFTAADTQAPPIEVVHLLIVEELNEQSIQLSENSNLIKAVETRIQEMITHQPELSKLDVLEQQIHNVVADILKQEDGIFATFTEDLSSGEKLRKMEDIKIPSSVQTKTLPEECIRPLIIQELCKQNVEPSQDACLVKAIESQIQSLIDVNPKVCAEEVLSERVHNIVAEVLKEQRAHVLDAEELATAKEIETKVEHIKIPSRIQTETIPNELIHSVIIDELYNQDIQSSDDSNLVTAIETRVKRSIDEHSEECQHKILTENIHDIVAEVLKEQQAQICTTEELSRAEETNTKVEPVDIASPIQSNIIPQELIHSIIHDELYNQNIQSSDDASLMTIIETQVQNLIVVNPEVCDVEVLSEKVHDIIAEVLKEQRAEVVNHEEMIRATVKQISDENIKIPSTDETQAISEEVLHDLIIDELHKQNVKQSEEASLIKAVEIKLQNIIAACPELSKEDISEGKVQDIIAEMLEEQRAIAVTTEELKYAVEEQVKIEDILKVPTTYELRIPDDIHKMIDDELHERNIELSIKQNLIEAINTKVLALVQQQYQMPEKVIIKESIRDVVSEELLKEKEINQKVESFDKVPEHMVKSATVQIPSETAEHVSEEVVHELIVEAINKQNTQPSQTDVFVKAVETQVRNLIDKSPEISNANRIEETVRDIITAKLTDQQEKSGDGFSAVEGQQHDQASESLPKNKIQMPEEVIEELIIKELHRHSIEEDTNLLNEIKMTVQNLIDNNLECADRTIVEEKIKTITASAVTELKTPKSKCEDTERITKQNKEVKDLKTPSTVQSDVLEEIVHELIIDELSTQNVQPSEEANLVNAIQTKFQDLIAQQSEVSQEHIDEDSIHEIVTKNLEKQNANMLETKQFTLANQENYKHEVLNLPSSTQIHIPDEIVHDMIIDEYHKQNIEPLAEENFVKAIEARVHDLIANHPEIGNDDMFEESIHDIVNEVRAEQKANIMETESLAKANKQNVKVEVSPPPNTSPAVASEKVGEDKLLKAADAQPETFEGKKHAKSLELKDQNESDKHVQISKNEKLETEGEPNETAKNRNEPKLMTIEKKEKEDLNNEQRQLANEVMTRAETWPSNIKQKEEDDIKNEYQREDIQLQADVEDQSHKKHNVQQKCERGEFFSTHVPVVAPAVNTDSEFDSELSECSKSTLQDISHLQNRKLSIPPMIEIDYDISSAKEMSSHRSMASTKRFREQQSFDLDDRSLGAYSSTTSRVQSFSHGPRDRGKKPTFCTKLTDRTAAEASRIKLTCTVLGDPEPEVYWTKDGKQLPSSTNRHSTTIENGLASLEFYAVTPKDSGEYSCIATNIHGQSCTESKLKVYAGYEPTPSLPTFTRSIKDSYRVDENALILECRVRGQPSPIITWLKDGQVLEICDRYQQSDLADGICRLKILKPDFYDSGLYTCRAENDTRLSDRTSHLVNFEATGHQRCVPSWQSNISCLDITSTYKDTGRPRFSSYLTDHNVPAGGTIALQVEVKGVPPPEITWMRTDKRGPISVPKARTFADSGVYTLIVPDATESETGTYVCRASNAYGHVDTSANVEVVSGSAHDGGKPAMFVSRPPDKHVIVAVGEDVSVSFRTTGVPKPRVIWMKGLRDITSGPRSYKEGHDDYVRLTLKRACPSDEGTYCILVKNCYGCDRSFFTVQVRQRARSLTPSPDWGPLDTDNLLSNIHDKERSYLKKVPGPISSEPVVVDGGRNWLALTWGKAEQRGPAPVVAYRVDAWLLGGEGGARWAELGVTPINAFDAFNLRPGEEYKFRITPRNRYGWGEPVTMHNSVTVREIVKFPEFTKILPGQLKALAGTVLNLEAEVTSDSSAQVKWYCDTTEIENGQDSRFTTYFNGSKCSLMIGNISESDSSRYVCEAINAAGRVSTFARVQVVEDIKVVEADLNLRKMRSSEIMNEERPPEFTMRLRDRRVQATYPVRLTCQVTGYPEPEVTWYKYREEIYSHENVAIWNDEAHFHTLEISRSTIDDSGIYMARAKNVYGSVTCRCHLVVDKGIRAYIAPEFLGHLDSVYTVRAGGELRMTAQVEAYPTVGITWHRDGHRLRPSRDVIMTLNHDGTVELELAHVTPRDAGLYCCTANNEVGQAESTTRVTVMEAIETNNLNQSVPKVIQTSDTPYSKVPLFVTKPLSTEAFEGDTVIIQCEVIGDPKPEVMWLRDFLRPDYYKDAPHFRRVGAGPQYRLEIPYAKFDFTGTYSIIAKNCHGEAKTVISLQIYARGQGKEDSGMESTIKHGNVQTLPVIKRPLRDLRCCDGDAITLVCKIRATPEPDVRWEKGEKLVPLGGDFAADFDGETARLSIQHVYPEDEGEYTCVAYNDLGKAYTSACLIVDVPEGKETALSRRLTKPPGFLSANSTPISTPRSTPVRSLSPSCASRRELKPMMKISRGQTSGRRPRMPTGPKFYAVPHNRVAEEGETVRFQCAVAGHPAPWVTWDKDGISVTPTARISLTEKDDVRILEITEITHEDAGLYRITLENDVGRTEATARLEIIRGRHNSVSRLVRTRSASPRTYSTYGRSHLSPSPRPDTRLQPPRANDTYSSRGGTISPTLPRWHQRNGKQSVKTDMKPVSNGNKTMQSSTKIIRSSSIPREASSEKKFDEKTLPGSPMTFRKHIKTQSIQFRSPSNQSPAVRNRVEANPKSKLPKKRSSTLISPMNVTNKSKIPLHDGNNDVSALSLTSTTTTTMMTTANQVIPRNFSTKREKYISMEPKSPIILAAPADVIALRGGKVTLLATYDGYPKPTIKWLRKGHYMTLDDKTEIETGGGLTCLTLTNITSNESGKYEVRIENTVGSDSRYVNVTVEGPPEPPADKPTIHSVIPSGITLTWRTPVYDGGCAVTGYTVEMRRGDEPCWIAVAEARHSLTHTVQQLDATESYRFRVRAENIHGLSEPGMESDVITISSEATADKMSNNIFGIEMNNENESEDEFEPAFEARIVSTEPGKLFEERYDVLEELGKGRYGIVRRIIDTASGLNLAAKFVRTIKCKDRQQVHDEINIMNILRHPKLLRLAAAYENPKEMIMVTEFISGGELFERVVADDFTLTEKDSILFVRQICQGVEYMHNNNIVHLDLKPENIMCHTRTSHRIKLIDFGLAQTLKPDTPVRVLFGTPEFIPPEIIGFEPIGTESDMWSVGVICYVLLSGLSPFMGENDAETFANITRADHDFDDKAFHAISEEAQDFISALLIKRKELRMSATDCLKHPWLAQRDESMSRVALPTDKLKKFIVRRKWQKTGNAIRALGRMATLSANSRRNMSSSPPLSKPFDEDTNRKIFSDDINKEPIEEHIEHFTHPSPENSPDKLKNISYINEYDNNEVEIEEIDDEIEELQTSIDSSLDEMLEQNSNDLDNADSLTIRDTERSNSFDEYTRLENNKNIFKFDDSNSTTSQYIDNETSTTEFPNTLDEISSENDTMFTAIDSSSNDNTVTLDISPKSLRAITEECENNTSRFCTFKNLRINEPVHESTAFAINQMEIMEENEKDRSVIKVETSTEDKQEELSSVTGDQVPPTRPSFIDIKSSNNPHDCVPKPWFHTNPSSLDSEGEVTRIVKNSPLRRVVRTGSVSRTAKLFEQDELSSPIRQVTSPGSRIVIPAPDARPQNERIRKAFAFWNK